MNQDDKKKMVAAQAIDHCMDRISSKTILGIGTGSTTNYFIDMLVNHSGKFAATVASSEQSAQRLMRNDIDVLDLNDVDRIDIYVDGADEVNTSKEMIKGGGGALTREKILAQASDEFVCIVDDSKQVDVLGSFPLPVEVVPMALEQVSKTITALGGECAPRGDYLTDNGNRILDVSGMRFEAAADMERHLNNIPGVVTNGLFAIRPADVVLVS